MNDSIPIPSAEDIATLEQHVNLARQEVHICQQLLRDKGDALKRINKITEVAFVMIPPLDDDDEEARRAVFLIRQAELGQAVEELEFAKEKCRVDEVARAREETRQV